MGDVVLSAGVRQNLLSLQNTAQLMSLTQNRLATGKKVNSALDNPASFFTSQSLNNRAGDLNALLDSIGQAQQTLKAADQGITSLTKLVESAKSIAKQARQAAQPSSAGYSAIAVSGNPTDETLGTFTGDLMANAVVAGTDDISIAVTVSGTTTNVTVDDLDLTGADDDAVVVAIQAAIDASAVGAGKILVSTDGVGNGTLTMAALDTDVDFTITANATTNEIGLTTDAVTNRTTSSTSLLDSIGTSGYTLSVAVNGGSAQQITFGNNGGAGQVSTLAELNTKIGTLTGVTGSASNSAVAFNVASSTAANSLTLTSSNASLTTALGLGAYASTGGTTTSGTAYTTTANATRTSLQNDFNDVLDQIDTLASDASYNGINLLNGDDLKVAFNESGASSLTIAGVTYDAAGLGLSAASGTGFQSDTNIDNAIADLDTALSTLRTQASKFGSNLTTVQTRQDFTKNLIATLQTGADNLVLADTNEEGANMLALQTRQQLSTTALSLSAQADQAVLRLFG